MFRGSSPSFCAFICLLTHYVKYKPEARFGRGDAPKEINYIKDTWGFQKIRKKKRQVHFFIKMLLLLLQNYF